MIQPVETTTAQNTRTDLSRLRRLFLAIGVVRTDIRDPLLACIPWMQIKHPLVPVQQRFLEKEALENPPARAHLAARLAASVVYAFYLSARILQARQAWAPVLRRLQGKKFSLIAKSWWIGDRGGAESSSRDFYLGDLQNRLERKGFSVLVLFGDPNGESWKLKPDRQGTARLCELAVVPLWAPFAVLARQLLVARRLASFDASGRDPVSGQVARLAAADVISRGIMNNALYEWVGRESTRRWRPKGWLSIYEGNGWEQQIWAGVKGVDRDCRTIGYQHTILLRHNLSLLQPEGARFNVRPDAVLCLGPRAAQMMAPAHPGSRMARFGSFRSGPAAHERRRPQPERRTVLVVPEGYPWEAKLLFESAIRAARVLPDWRFILRCHPVLPFERVRGLLEESPEQRTNVEISRERTLQEEMGRSCALLYRGSSVVLYAVQEGLKPFYLDDARYPDVDPLFEIQGWKETAASPEELVEGLRRFAADGQDTPAWRSASDYVREYVVPVDGLGEENLAKELERSRGSRR